MLLSFKFLIMSIIVIQTSLMRDVCVSNLLSVKMALIFFTRVQNANGVIKKCFESHLHELMLYNEFNFEK